MGFIAVIFIACDTKRESMVLSACCKEWGQVEVNEA